MNEKLRYLIDTIVVSLKENNIDLHLVMVIICFFLVVKLN